MEDIFEELAAHGTDDEGREEDNPGGNKDDEAVEANDTRRVVKPKRVVSRPQPKLDTTRLLGPRGIFTVKSSFDNVKFKGKGHELDDLNNVLSRLQHWAHRLFPKMTFVDCIEKIENLGSKREILTNMHKLRMGMVDLDGGVQTQDDVHVDDDPAATPPAEDNAFDQLVATVPAAPTTTLTEEQRARMMRNRLLAEERRMARRLAREKELEEQRQTTNMAADESRSSGVADVEMSNTPAAEYVNTPGSDPELATNSVSCATNVNNDTTPLATNGTDQDNVSSSSSTVPVDPSLSIDPQQILLHSADEVSTATCVDNTSSPGTTN